MIKAEKKRILVVGSYRPCLDCNSTGYRDGYLCPRCLGEGRLYEERRGCSHERIHTFDFKVGRCQDCGRIVTL